jgi:hypothetical protein
MRYFEAQSPQSLHKWIQLYGIKKTALIKHKNTMKNKFCIQFVMPILCQSSQKNLGNHLRKKRSLATFRNLKKWDD